MTCHVCGSQMKRIITDLPFKASESTIIIIKDLPVFQCGACREYLLEDPIMERVETLLNAADKSVELEIVRFAA